MNLEIVETPRLKLKVFSPADLAYIFENLPKPEVMALLGHRSEEDYQKEAHKQQNGYTSYNRSFLLFQLLDKASGKIIGRCGLHNWNIDHGRAEAGYNMEDEDFKRKGLMSEALGAVIAYGFGRLNLHRIEALVSAGNIASIRLMEKYNFIREGLLREHYYVAGKHEDSIMFSKLRSEYFAGKGGQDASR